MRRFARRPAALVALIVLILLASAAIFAPFVAPYDPTAASWSLIRKAPSAAHWMGTDENGRDVFSRVIFGARSSLAAGVVAVALAASIGVPAGLAAGAVGGWLDAALSRVVDALLAVPFLILAIALASFLGPSLRTVMIAIGVTQAPIFMRVARAAALEAAQRDYVEAAKASGARGWVIAFRHIAPAMTEPLLVQITIGIATAIVAEASLSFLGLGPPPPAPSWGSMLNAAQRFMTQAPWLAICPGAAIFVTVLAFNLVGDGLRDSLDHRR